jgi:hypothetical protein
MRIGGLFVTKSRRGRPTLAKRLQKNIERLVYPSKRRRVLVFELSELLNDSNLNTLVEIRGAVVEEAIGRHYFEEANNVGGATNWNLVDKSGNQVYLRSSFADFATKIVPW